MNPLTSSAEVRRRIAGIHRRHMREWALLWRQWRNCPEFAETFLKTAISRRDWSHTARTLLLFAFFLFNFSSASAAEIPAKFFTAIHTVETSRRTGPILGDGGRALGPYQIHRAYWQDANVPGTYAQVADERYARRVVTAYLTRYARAAVANGDLETLARIHNGGPLGHRRAGTLPYWHRVRRQLGDQP